MKIVYAADWIEYERGWGSRPDGTTYHKDLETAIAFIKAHDDKLPNDHVPDEYSKASTPKPIEVTEEVYKKVQEEGSIWK